MQAQNPNVMPVVQQQVPMGAQMQAQNPNVVPAIQQPVLVGAQMQAQNAAGGLAVEVQPLDFAWIKVREFAKKEDFKAFLKEEGDIWSTRDVQTTNEGIKTIYRCNRVKRKGPQCTSGIYTKTESCPNDQIVKLYQKTLPHNHDEIDNARYGLSDYAKKRIIDLFEARNKPAAILYVLSRDENIQHVSLNQVKNTIETYKKSKYGRTNITLNELENFVKERMVVPENEDDSFVINFERSPVDQVENKWFRYLVSTKRMLRIAINAKNIHADSTYKICVQGYPLIVVGATDFGGHFHLLGLMLATNETGDDFRSMFRALEDAVANVHEQNMEPGGLISDGAGAIHIGFKDTFGEGLKIIMCWFHVMQNFNKYKLNDAANRDSMRDDLRKLKLSYNEEVFVIGSRLLLEK